MGLGYSIRTQKRKHVVGYRFYYQDAEGFAIDRARRDNRAMVIVDLSTGRARAVVDADGSVSPVTEGHSG